METIGEKIYKLRKKMGFSQEELGFKVGVSRQTVSKWESNAMNPNMDSIQALCVIFQVNADYFLSMEKEEISDVQIEAAVASLPNENNRIKKICIIQILLSILFVVFLVLTTVFGFSALTGNQGDVVCVTPDIDLWGMVCLICIDCILLAINLGLLILKKKLKKRMQTFIDKM